MHWLEHGLAVGGTGDGRKHLCYEPSSKAAYSLRGGQAQGSQFHQQVAAVELVRQAFEISTPALPYVLPLFAAVLQAGPKTPEVDELFLRVVVLEGQPGEVQCAS
jgi:non-ribosomal peptide synthetase component F